ncbi:hypothetical protein ACXYMT_07425 [Salinimicrobium sp. CAU 1759]
MKAKTIKGTSPAKIQAALDESTRDGFKPTLSIITLTNIENAEPLRSIFDRNGIAIFGITTAQKFTEKGMESDDIVAMLWVALKEK